MPTDAKEQEVQLIAEIVCVPAEVGGDRGFAVLANSANDLGLATIICCGSVANRPEHFGQVAAEAAHALARAIASARPEIKALVESATRDDAAAFSGLRGPG